MNKAINNLENPEQYRAMMMRYNTVPSVESVFVDLLEQQAAMHDQIAEHFRDAVRLIQNSDDY